MFYEGFEIPMIVKLTDVSVLLWSALENISVFLISCLVVEILSDGAWPGLYTSNLSPPPAQPDISNRETEKREVN